MKVKSDQASKFKNINRAVDRITRGAILLSVATLGLHIPAKALGIY